MKPKLTVPLVAVVLLVGLLAATPVLGLQGNGFGAQGGAEQPPALERVAGTVVRLDATAGIITIQTRERNQVRVQTTERTRFARQLQGGGTEPIKFGDIALRDQVQAMGAWDGRQFRARQVTVMLPPPPPPIVVCGTIAELADSTITVQTQDGELVTVRTTEETRFSRQLPGGALVPIAFADLVVGDRVHIRGVWEDDTFLARHVVVLLPRPPSRIAGKIIELNSVELTIWVQPCDRDPVLVKTTTETQFSRLSPAGLSQPITFEDLVVGDPIIALGAWDESGDAFNAVQVTVMGGQRLQVGQTDPGPGPGGTPFSTSP